MSRLTLLVVLALALFVPLPAHADHGYCGWGGISLGGYGYGYGYGYRPRLYRNFYYGNDYYPYGPSFYGGYEPHGIYYSPYDGYSSYYLPPVFAPAELLYGPRAVKQFLGIADQPQVLLRDDPPDEPRVRVANATYRRKADQLITQGDVLFREQKYTHAIDRYKEAAERAPDMAETHWRKGHAYVAMHRYELAAAAFKRALALEPDVVRGDFSLSQLYGPAATVKTSHLEALAGETLVRSDSADLYFLLGVFLRYDGQAERAEKFFVRALDLAGSKGGYLAAFFPKADEPVPVAADELET